MTREIASERAKELCKINKKRYFVVLRGDGQYTFCSADSYHNVMKSGLGDRLCIVERHFPKEVQ